jgi:activator of HSP90 ATPase
MNDGDNASSIISGTNRRQMMVGVAAFAGLRMCAAEALTVDDGISRSAESIHQEPVFKARPQRLYEVLIDPKQFDQLVQHSAAMKSKEIGNRPSEISDKVGGAFTLFGGHIVGRQLELVPNQRIVQAWRSQGWKPGAYSIVSFELTEQDSGTKIIFDHKGFPQGQSAHLAAGWKGNYWDPLEKVLLEKK